MSNAPSLQPIGFADAVGRSLLVGSLARSSEWARAQGTRRSLPALLNFVKFVVVVWKSWFGFNLVFYFFLFCQVNERSRSHTRRPY